MTAKVNPVQGNLDYKRFIRENVAIMGNYTGGAEVGR